MNYRPPFLAVICLLLLFTSCKTTPPVQPDELLGLPPTEKEDPFFFVTLPAEAEEANASGRIGDDTTDEKSTSKDDPTKKVQCFSCVKICESAPCEDADKVCGWGVDFEKENAMLRATAECDGALDLARNNPNLKQITGSCPVATCK